MFPTVEKSSLYSGDRPFSNQNTASLINKNDLERVSLQKITSFRSAKSRLEIGTFNRVFSSSGSVRRDFPDVFRFNLSSRQRLRIYLGNEFPSSSSSNRRMAVDLLNDSNLRRVTGVNVIPARIDAITTTLSPGTYRIRISTQSSSRGRYFLDMIRI